MKHCPSTIFVKIAGKCEISGINQFYLSIISQMFEKFEEGAKHIREETNILRWFTDIMVSC